MRQILLFIAFWFPAPLIAEDAGTEWPECYCTDRFGARHELGQTLCMKVDGRSFVAQCQMSLNSPMWREISGECLVSERLGDGAGERT